MRPPSLRSQLNQIRLWLRQGRTDAWIAHKLDISVGELESFKRDHRVTGDPPPAPALEVERVPPPEPEEERVEDEDEDDGAADEAPEEDGEARETDETEAAEAGEASEAAGEEEQPRRRRRGRRGGRRRTGSRTTYEATFDHGEDGYGLWLDPSVADNPIYSEHWAGHRPVSVTVEVDTITIRRSGGEEA